jgi:predicted alpha/beta hydrolase family esterase
MKTSDATLLFVPGYKNSPENHWQSRWADKISTAQRVVQEDWHKPEVNEWTRSLINSVSSAPKPVILIAHSIGVHLVSQAIHGDHTTEGERQILLQKIKGAFLVAPPDVENPDIKPKHLMTFGPYARAPFPFPTLLIGSTNDHFCTIDKAEEMSKTWNSLFINAGEQGHINGDSGHGPWPEGLMVFSKFMKNI